MSRTRLLVGLAVAAVLLGVAPLLLDGRGETDAGEADAGESSTAGGGAGNGSSAGSGRTGDGPAASDEPRESPRPATRPENELAPVREVPADARTASENRAGGLPGIRPPRTGPLVSRPLPGSASSRGRLVAGHPTGVLPVVPGSQVRTSSVSTGGRTLQVALVGEAATSEVSIARFYRVSLARLGFRESQVPAVGGSTAVGFRRGQDSVVLTTTPLGGKRCTYSLFGILRASHD